MEQVTVDARTGSVSVEPIGEHLCFTRWRTMLAMARTCVFIAAVFVTSLIGCPAEADPLPPPTAMSLLAQSRGCHGDNRCVVAALEGHARSEPEVGLLATTYRLMGNRTQAERVMRLYLSRWPAGPRAQSYLNYLATPGPPSPGPAPLPTAPFPGPIPAPPRRSGVTPKRV